MAGAIKVSPDIMYETKSDENDSLRILVDKHRDELHHHEDYISSVLTWTLTIMLALIGAYLAFVSTDQMKNHPDWLLKLKIGMTILLAVLAALAIRELFSRVEAMDANARIIVTASQKLGFFDKNNFGQTEPLYPEIWLTWGDRNYSSTKIMPTFHLLVLLVVGVGGILTFWLIG